MKKVVKINLVQFGIIFFLGLISIMKFPIIPNIVIRFIKFIAVFFSIMYTIKNLEIVKIKQNIDVIIFCFIIVFSSFLNYHLTSYFVYSLVYSIILFGYFINIQIAVEKNGIQLVAKLIFFCFFISCIINDVFLKIYINGDYLIGTKFSVSYWHCMLIAFFVVGWRTKKFSHKIFLMLLVFCEFLICTITNCSTGKVEIVIFLLLLIFSKKIKKLITHPVFILMIVFFMGYSLYLWDNILSMNYVRNFIENTLHESLSMSGRIQIYRILPELIREKFLIGWGYSTEIVRNRLYGNAQNGIWHIGIQYGIVGICIFGIIILNSFICKEKTNEYDRFKLPLSCLIYTFVFISCVEISYSHIFFIALAFYRAICMKKNLDREENIYGKHVKKSSKKGIRVII